MNKKRFFIALMSFAAVIFAGIAVLSYPTAAATQSSQEYALQYDRYKLKGDATVTYNGKKVRTVNGYVTFKNEGVYTVDYSSNRVEVNVYKVVPASEFVLSEDFSSVAAGVPYVLPTLKIVDFLGNEIYDYTVSVVKGETEVLRSESGENVEYVFRDTGDYTLKFEYDTIFGVKDVYEHPVSVTDKKVITVSNYDKRPFYINEVLDLSKFYGYYMGVEYECFVTVNGKAVTTETYSFSSAGVYSISAVAVIEGERLKYDFDLNVKYDASKSFTTYNCLEVTDSLVTLPEEPKKRCRSSEGVEILTKESDSYAVFGGIVDLTKLSKNQNLIEFHVLSNDFANMDFINVRLIDIYDPNNWVLVRWLNCLDGGGTAKEKGNHSYVYVSTSSGIDTISKKGTTVANGFVNHYATFYAKLRGWTGMFQLQMDYSELQLYHYSGLYNGQNMLVDLDDATDVGNEKAWKGFNDGKCYVQLEFLSVSGERSGVIVTQIAGQNIGKYFDDTESFNTITVDTDMNYIQNGLPCGVAGVEYALPSANDENVVSGKYNAERKLYFGSEDITAKIRGNVFTPESVGDYTLSFYSADVFGRAIRYDMPFSVIASHSDVVIEKTDISEPAVYSYWQIPEFSYSGGHGILESTVKVFVDGAERETDEAGQIYIEGPCEISVDVSVSDYLGFIKEERYDYSVSYEGVYFDIKGLPEFIIKGQTIEIPHFKAYNCALDVSSTGYNMTAGVFIDGVKYEEGAYYKVPENAASVKFSFVADKGKITQKTKTFEIAADSVATTGDMSDYFSVTGTVTAATKSEYQSFSVGSDAEIKFKNALSADNLNLQFGFESAVTGMSYFTIRLSDYYDSSRFVDLDVYNYNDGYSKLVTADAVGYIPGSYSGTTYNFYYNNIGHNLQSSLGVQYLKIDRTARNNVFNGFTGGILKLSFLFRNVSSEVKFKIISIGNQSFNSFVYAGGDKKGPMITFNKTMESYLEVEKGDRFDPKGCKAYDVLQGLGDISVSLVDSAGNSIYKNTDISKTKSFTFDKYGYWVLTYTAIDALGNREQKKINIYVFDRSSPVIKVNLSGISDRYSVNSEMTVPSASVTDDSEYTLKIYVLSPDGKYNYITDTGKYKFDKKGVYHLCYLAYDVNYNVSRAEKTITVY